MTSSNEFDLADLLIPIISAMTHGVLVIDATGTILLYNEPAKVLIPDLETLMANNVKRFEAILDIDDEATFLHQLKNQAPQTINAKNGEIIIEAQIRPFQIPQHPVIYLCNLMSPRVEQPGELSNVLGYQARLYRQIFERKMSSRILVNPLNKRIIDANKTALEFYGYTRAEMLKLLITDIVALENSEVDGHLALMMKKGREFVETEHRLANGEVRTVLAQATQITVEGKRYIYVDVNDITLYTEAQREILHRDQRYRIMIEQMQQGVSIHDEAGQIVYVNNAFCTMLGYKSFELLGQSQENLFSMAMLDTLREQTAQRRRGYSDTYEIQMRHRDGHTIYVIISSSPYYDIDGAYIGAFGVFTDVSHHKQTEDALVKSNAELDAFAHTVAHDLKNPLSVLMGFADLLESEFKNMAANEVQYYLQTVGRTADKMISIIDELLLLSQMRYAEVKLTPFDIQQVISECLQRTRYMQLQYSAEINVINPDSMPEVVSYSPWIEAALVNYITNAIKYGGNPPKIEIGVSSMNDGRVRIWVRDNGAGIPQEKIGRVFVEFDRLEEVRKKGYGIGLSIVKRIMTKLDGDVHVESRVGEGSIFSLLLPAPVGV